MNENNVQRKHREEHEIVIDQALSDLRDDLGRAADRFDRVIGDERLKSEFGRGIDGARRVLVKLVGD